MRASGESTPRDPKKPADHRISTLWARIGFVNVRRVSATDRLCRSRFCTLILEATFVYD
jgi:hypothetical protein